jgi:putative glutamine amidotransferase
MKFDVSCTLVPQAYVEFLSAAGCMPVLLPLIPGVEDVIDRLDGLLLPGGADVDPARYGAPPHPETKGVSQVTDAAEFAMLERALDTGLPFFGICRGLQVLNVLRGGTLHQFLPDILGDTSHQPRPGTFGTQHMELKPGSNLASIYGGEATEVPCFHHQAIDRLGDGLVVTAKAKDGIVEAVEVLGHPFAVAVQWHADQIADDRPFLAFAEAARRTATNRAASASAVPSGA